MFKYFTFSPYWIRLYAIGVCLAFCFAITFPFMLFFCSPFVLIWTGDSFIHVLFLLWMCNFSRCVDANLVEIPIEVETPDHHYYHVGDISSLSDLWAFVKKINTIISGNFNFSSCLCAACFFHDPKDWAVWGTDMGKQHMRD